MRSQGWDEQVFSVYRGWLGDPFRAGCHETWCQISNNGKKLVRFVEKNLKPSVWSVERSFRAKYRRRKESVATQAARPSYKPKQTGLKAVPFSVLVTVVTKEPIREQGFGGCMASIWPALTDPDTLSSYTNLSQSYVPRLNLSPSLVFGWHDPSIKCQLTKQ